VKRLILISIYCTGLLGCQLQPQLSQPALLTEQNSGNIKKIKIIIEQALNSNNVFISQSAFTQNSQLIVQLKEFYTVARFNNPTFLSELDKPDRFMLLKDNRGCLLRHEQSQREWYLKGVNCVIAKKAEDTI
jgi:hypothetical protein